MKRLFITLVFICAVTAVFAQRKSKKKKQTTKAPIEQPAAPQTQVADTTKALPADSSVVPMNKRPRDGWYDNGFDPKVQLKKGFKKPMAYPVVRETDITFRKRVWREIDLREKVNTLFNSPKSRLIDILMEAGKNNEIRLYNTTGTIDDTDGDAFSRYTTVDEVIKKFTSTNFSFNPDSVIKFRIKEDFIFDKQRSIFEPRIVGIAPIYKYWPSGVAGQGESAELPMFWVHFESIRHVLANKPVMNRQSDATGLSYDDVFLKRLFNSYIIKESNPENLDLLTITGQDKKERLYKGEEIKKKLMDYEQNLWSY